MPDNLCTFNKLHLFLMQYNSPVWGFMFMSHVVLQYINLLCKCFVTTLLAVMVQVFICALIALRLISNKRKISGDVCVSPHYLKPLLCLIQ